MTMKDGRSEKKISWIETKTNEELLQMIDEVVNIMKKLNIE